MSVAILLTGLVFGEWPLPMPELKTTCQQGVTIPFTTGGSVETVRLYRSIDCGRSWELVDEQDANAKRFAQIDISPGMTWFTVQSVEKDGSVVPVVVGERPPLVRIFVTKPGEAVPRDVTDRDALRSRVRELKMKLVGR